MDWFDDLTSGVGSWWEQNGESITEGAGDFIGGLLGGDDEPQSQFDDSGLSHGNSGGDPVVSVPVNTQQQSGQWLAGVDNKLVIAGGVVLVLGVAFIASKG